MFFLYRQKIIAKNEEMYEEQSGRSTYMTIYEDDSETVEDSGNKRQELWAEKLFSIIGDGRNAVSVSLEDSCKVFLRNTYDEFGLGLPWFYFCLFTICFPLSVWDCFDSHLNNIDFSWLCIVKSDVLYT